MIYFPFSSLENFSSLDFCVAALTPNNEYIFIHTHTHTHTHTHIYIYIYRERERKRERERFELGNMVMIDL